MHEGGVAVEAAIGTTGDALGLDPLAPTHLVQAEAVGEFGCGSWLQIQCFRMCKRQIICCGRLNVEWVLGLQSKGGCQGWNVTHEDVGVPCKMMEGVS